MKLDESPFDLDFMIELTESIANVQSQHAKTKYALDLYKASITKHVTEKEKYWVNGKPASMAYIQSQYHVLGYDDQTANTLSELETKLIELDAELTKLRTRFSVEREKLDVWRTFSANARNTLNFVGSD